MHQVCADGEEWPVGVLWSQGDDLELGELATVNVIVVDAARTDSTAHGMADFRIESARMRSRQPQMGILQLAAASSEFLMEPETTPAVP